jgi:hypothetical protein
MQSLKQLSNAIAQSPRNSQVAAGLGQVMKVYAGVFQGQESVDSNLSQISIGQQGFRFVPRLSGAWTSAPAAGTTVLIGSIGGSLIILGTQLGDITKATH